MPGEISEWVPEDLSGRVHETISIEFPEEIFEGIYVVFYKKKTYREMSRKSVKWFKTFKIISG